jgi:hypothetical protein
MPWTIQFFSWKVLVKNPREGKEPLKLDKSSMESWRAKHVMTELLNDVSETVSVSVFRVSMQTLLPFLYTCRVTQTDGMSVMLNLMPPSECSYCKFLLDMVAIEFDTVPPHYTNTLRIHHLLLYLSLPLSLFILYLLVQFNNLPSLSLQHLFFIFLFLFPPLRHLLSTSHVFLLLCDRNRSSEHQNVQFFCKS